MIGSDCERDILGLSPFSSSIWYYEHGLSIRVERPCYEEA